MKDLQAIINQRAEAKLDKEISENLIKFLTDIDYKEFVEAMPPEKFNNWKLDSMLHPSNATGKWVVSKIKAKRLETYIEYETALFLNEIEALKQRSAQLEQDISSLNY